MPYDVIHHPDLDLDRSIGWLAVSWIESLCLHGNGDVIGQPIGQLTNEYANFIVMIYALDAEGRMLHHHMMLSRGKGQAKSEIAALVALFDALGPSRFDHFAEKGEVYVCPATGFTHHFEEGEPVGRPVNTPIVQCVATEESQAGEVYETCRFNCAEGPLAAMFPDKSMVGKTRIEIPGGGSIKAITASGDSKDGGKATLCILDETHLWHTKELHNTYGTLTRNLVKRRGSAGTFALETTTMFAQGQNSVAEQTYGLVKNIKSGKFKGVVRQLFSHRYSDITPEELSDVDKVREALIESYAETLAWNDLESMVEQVMDPRSDITASFRYWFNSAITSEDAWLTSWEFLACGPDAFNDDKEDKNYFPTPDPIQKGDVITLGFDGSRRRVKGVTDATALVACRVRDGVVFPIGIWEQPPDYHGEEGWEVPIDVVQSAMKYAFSQYRVVALYCDPALWQESVRVWESRWGATLKVKASTQHPCEYWMIGGMAKRTVQTIDRCEEAILQRELKHFDDPILTSHVLNARRKESTAGRQLGKETPNSIKKIDGAIAMILAWQARLDAVSKGLATQKKRTAYRLR